MLITSTDLALLCYLPITGLGLIHNTQQKKQNDVIELSSPINFLFIWQNPARYDMKHFAVNKQTHTRPRAGAQTHDTRYTRAGSFDAGINSSRLPSPVSL